MAELNPLELKITNVWMEKFNFTDKIDLFPQFVEISIYQSIFEPTIKAEMLINDNIGLFANYPFTGEEIITFEYQQLSGFDVTKPDNKKIKFIISGVRDIGMDDRARAMMFIIDLKSLEFLQNTRKYVSHAYHDLAEDMAEKVYNTYIGEDTKDKFKQVKPFIKEESIKIRNLVIPNLRPFQAIQWLAKHAVAKDYENRFLYLFYEDLESFNFVTIQKLISDAQKNKTTLEKNKYRYLSDIELADGIAIEQKFSNDYQLRLITNIVNNKRFSSIEKIAGGYYQNELFEISLLQKSYNSTPTEFDANSKPKYSLEQNPLNTKEYIEYVKNKKDKTEYSNRIRYIINNYQDSDDQDKTQPNFRYKFGNATKYLFALNQIDLTITVPANMQLKAGEIIYCDIPETHGFNQVEADKFLTGLYIITEVKQVVSQGNKAATTLRINKDGYLNSLFEKSLYNLEPLNFGGRGPA
jgi:hypothetical protein